MPAAKQIRVFFTLLKRIQEYAAYRNENTLSMHIAAKNLYGDYINNLILSDEKFIANSGYYTRSLHGQSSSLPHKLSVLRGLPESIT